MDNVSDSQSLMIDYPPSDHDCTEGRNSDFNQTSLNITPRTVSVDQMISDVGGCGIYQVLLCLLFSLANIPASYQILLMYFTGHSPSWRCVNSTACSYVGEITASDERFPARCFMPRDNWEYITPKDFSIVTEVQLLD